MASGVNICMLLYVIALLGAVNSQTYLRTGVVELSRWDRTLLAERSSETNSKQLRAEDRRWGPFLGRQTYILQIPQDLGHQETSLLLKALQSSNAIVGDYLPLDSYLLIADSKTVASNLLKDCTVAPYLAAYKIAPEWNAVLDVVSNRYESKQSRHSNPWDLHDEVVSHPHISSRLRLLQPTQDKQQQHRQLLQQHHARPHDYPNHLIQEGPDGLQLPPQLLIGVDFPFLHPEDLSSLNHRLQDFHPAEAAAAEWTSHLEQLASQGSGNFSLGYAEYCRPQVHVSSTTTLTVSVCPKDLKIVLDWLAHQSAVYWLYPKPQMRLHNLNAGAITQGSVSGKTFDASLPETHPLWSKGLDGQGQLVGVGDSGIDMDSCYFFDPEVPFATVGASPTGRRMFSSKSHRKVAAYNPIADPEMLDLVGHGTHVVGSIIGEKIGSRSDAATGVAPGARVAFLDLSKQADGADVNTPDNLMDNYFMLNYNLGVRVHSDSWGGWGAIYDTSSYYTDMMTWQNQDFVSILAAGNYGTSQKYSSTVTSPATAKNCITVGATLNYDPGYVSTPAVKIWVMELMIKRPGLADQNVIRRLVQADFGGSMDGLTRGGASTPVTLADPPNACAPISKAAAGSIVLVKRGDCFFANKLKAASDAGAVGVLVVNDRGGGYFKMEAQEGESISTTIPMLGISKRLGDGLWTLISYASSGAASFTPAGTGQPSYDDIASFSSFGPTQDQRTKPDVVAPGALVSAASDRQLTGAVDTCATSTKRGTSMATPVVAGNALLIRQYFTDGFYPIGRAVEANKYEPSGPLIKGVLLGGAIDMVGNTVEGLPLDPMGSRQGYGRVNLMNSLKLVGGAQNLQVVDLAVLQQGEKHSYCVKGIGGPIAVTLTWYDYPAAPPSDPSVPLLINDLDLSMRAAGLSNALLLGNGAVDRLNTVEKITVADLPAGDITIEVTAVKISSKTTPKISPSQKYALVVQGAFSGVLASGSNPDPAAKTATAGACASTAAAIAGSDTAVKMASVDTAAAPAGGDTAVPAAAPADVGAGAGGVAPAGDSPATAAPQAASLGDSQARQRPGPEATAAAAAAADVVPPADAAGGVSGAAVVPAADAAAVAAAAVPAVPAATAEEVGPGPAAAAAVPAPAAVVPEVPAPAPVEVPAPINPNSSKDALLTSLISSMVPTQGRRLAAVMAPLKTLSVPQSAAAALCHMAQISSSIWKSHQPPAAAAAAADGSDDDDVDQSSVRHCQGVGGLQLSPWGLAAAAAAVVLGAAVVVVLLAGFVVRKLAGSSPATAVGGSSSSGVAGYNPLSNGCEKAAARGARESKVAAVTFAVSCQSAGSLTPPRPARRSLKELLFSRNSGICNSFLNRCKSSSSSALEKGLSLGLTDSEERELQTLVAPVTSHLGPLPHGHSDSELEIYQRSQLHEDCVQGFAGQVAAKSANVYGATLQQQPQRRVQFAINDQGRSGNCPNSSICQQGVAGGPHLPPKKSKTFSAVAPSRGAICTAADALSCCTAPPAAAAGGGSCGLGTGSSQWSLFPQQQQQQQQQQQHLLPVSSPPSSPTRSAQMSELVNTQQHAQQQQQQLQCTGSVVVELSPPDSPLSSPFVAASVAPWEAAAAAAVAAAADDQVADCVISPGKSDRSSRGIGSGITK